MCKISVVLRTSPLSMNNTTIHPNFTILDEQQLLWKLQFRSSAATQVQPKGYNKLSFTKQHDLNAVKPLQN